MSHNQTPRFGSLLLSRAEIDGLRTFIDARGELKPYVPVAAMGPSHTTGRSIMRLVAKSLEERGFVATEMPRVTLCGKTLSRHRATLTDAGRDALELYRDWMAPRMWAEVAV